MGLNHPRDLDAWQAWQRSRTPLRALRNRFRTEQPLSGLLSMVSADPQVLVVLDWLAPTSLTALFSMTSHLSVPYAVLSPSALPNGWSSGWPGTVLGPRAEVVPEELTSVAVVVAAGHYLPLGVVAYAWSRLLGAEFVAVQHGLLTPHVPPLAPDSRLLAWSAADADFWRSGRADVSTEVVGSQLLWEAAEDRARSTDDRPTFLGQLHSAEIGRRTMARFRGPFCRSEGLRYRPHPGETRSALALAARGLAPPGHRLRRRRRCRCATCLRPWSASSRPASSRPPPAGCRPGRRSTRRPRG